MRQELIEKYLTSDKLNEYGETVTRKGARVPPQFVYDKVRKLRKKGKSDEQISKMLKVTLSTVQGISESSGTGGSSELWFGSWSRPLLIYMQEDEVLFSYNHEFPPGYKMTEDDIKRARARGFILVPV